MCHFEDELERLSQIEDLKERFKKEVNLFKEYFGDEYLEAWRIYIMMDGAVELWGMVLNNIEEK